MEEDYNWCRHHRRGKVSLLELRGHHTWFASQQSLRARTRSFQLVRCQLWNSGDRYGVFVIPLSRRVRARSLEVVRNQLRDPADGALSSGDRAIVYSVAIRACGGCCCSGRHGRQVNPGLRSLTKRELRRNRNVQEVAGTP